MGTAKYPSENEYGRFLNEHGGFSNAFTAETHTTYYFDVHWGDLRPALDRFAQFFVAPLFNPGCTEREMLAVDSENKKNLLQDNWRAHQLEKSLGNPRHPYHHFGTGNLETLGAIPREKGLDIRSVLIDFYQAHYSANLMTVVVMGRETLDELQAWIQADFAGVPNSNAAAPAWPDHLPWTEGNHGSLTRIKTIKDSKSVSMNWLIPRASDGHDQHPQKYYSYLLGDEGEGSLLALLKKKHWATALYAGGGDDSPGYVVFEVQIELSDDGFANYQEVIRLTHDYICMLQRTGPNERVFQEAQAINQLHFRFREKQDPATYAHRLARNVHKYPAERVLIGESAPEPFDPELLKAFGDILANGQPRVFLSSKEHDSADDGWHVEKWYGTEYQVKSLAELGITLEGRPNAELTLPNPNEFLPSAFDVLIKPGLTDNFAVPKLVEDKLSALKLWHKVDDQFEVPKVNLNLLFRSPLVRQSARSVALLHLYTELVKEELNAVAYPADTAGLKYDIGLLQDGIELRLSGFYDKMHVLLEKVLRAMVNPSVFTAKGFDLRRDTYERYLRNLDHEGPYWISSYFVNGLTQEGTWWKWEILDVLPSLSVEDIVVMAKDYFKTAQIECLVHGSVADPHIYTDQVKAIIGAPQAPSGHLQQSMKLNDGSAFVYLPKVAPNPNSGAEFYLQISSTSEVQLRALARLFVQAFNEPFFDVLRTQEQLGYLVNMSLKDRGSAIGIRCAIQSERDPLYLDARMETFLASLPAAIAAMPDEDFARVQSALVGKLRERKTRLGTETAAYWDQIARQAYEFDRAERDAQAVEGLTKDDLLAFVQARVAPGALQRRKLAVHVWSESIPADMQNYAEYDGHRITDINQFWASIQRY